MTGRWMTLTALVLLLLACKGENDEELALGSWLAQIEVSESRALPFNFTLSKEGKGGYIMKIYNAQEEIIVDEIELRGDSLHIRMPVFEGYLTGTFTNTEMQGKFVEPSKGRSVNFIAVHGPEYRFQVKEDAGANISGIWETYFNINRDNEYAAKGIFMQNDNHVKGTFRTKTGDYRFLEGVVTGDSLKMSAFDGAHVYLFLAQVSDSTLEGKFYSGNHSVQNFMAARNEVFELPEAESLTHLKEGYDRFDFSFPDMDGNMVSLQDHRFKDKVTLVQIMGTWCPNCLDETRFYVEFLENHPNLDLEFVALAFEYAKTPEKAFEAIARLKERAHVPYPILLAQYGTSNKQLAHEKLPMLDHILSYPTTIYIDKKGEVRMIHTGFNGPATGDKYEEFKERFSEVIKEMTEE